MKHFMFLVLLGVILVVLTVVISTTGDMTMSTTKAMRYGKQKPLVDSGDDIIPFSTIVQTWKSKELLPNHYKYRQTILSSIPKHWTTPLMTDPDLEIFVNDHFDWFKPVWKHLNLIKKIDTFKYMYLYKFSSMYCDMDINIKQQNWLRIFKKQGLSSPVAWIPVTDSSIQNWNTDSDMSSPSIMAAEAGHPLFLLCLRNIARNFHHYVIKATGPICLSNALQEFHAKKTENPNLPGNLVLLSCQSLGMSFWSLLNKKILVHENTNSETWKKHADFNHHIDSNVNIPESVFQRIDQELQKVGWV
jgi:mannosyltransferase OCH1-like enzyme